MGNNIITIRVMPSSLEADLKNIENSAKKEIQKFKGKVGKVEIKPVAFGLKSLDIIFLLDEKISNIEELEKSIKKIKDVESVNVIDIRRALG